MSDRCLQVETAGLYRYQMLHVQRSCNLSTIQPDISAVALTNCRIGHWSGPFAEDILRTRVARVNAGGFVGENTWPWLVQKGSHGLDLCYKCSLLSFNKYSASVAWSVCVVAASSLYGRPTWVSIIAFLKYFSSSNCWTKEWNHYEISIANNTQALSKTLSIFGKVVGTWNIAYNIYFFTINKFWNWDWGILKKTKNIYS